jgi:hypothetical protein
MNEFQYLNNSHARWYKYYGENLTLLRGKSTSGSGE